MKRFQKILYYIRLILFIISMIFIFFTLKNYIKLGIYGYIFLSTEFIYILILLLTILSKKELYISDFVFNIMHIGTYLYQIILSIRMFSFNVSSIIKDSLIFYRNNYIILTVLILTLIFYSAVLYSEVDIKKIKKS